MNKIKNCEINQFNIIKFNLLFFFFNTVQSCSILFSFVQCCLSCLRSVKFVKFKFYSRDLGVLALFIRLSRVLLLWKLKFGSLSIAVHLPYPCVTMPSFK